MGVVNTKPQRYTQPHDQLILRVNSRSDIVDVCNTLVAAGIQPDAVSCEHHLTKYVWIQANEHNQRVVTSPVLRNHLAPTVYRSPGEFVHEFSATNQHNLEHYVNHINNRRGLTVNAVSAPTTLGPKYVFVNRV